MSYPPVRCIIFGTGGIGTYLGTGLSGQVEAQAPGSTVILVDGDTFEPKNKARQLFTEAGLKAVSFAKFLRTVYDSGEVIFQAIPAWVVPKEMADIPNDDPEDPSGKIAAEDLMMDGDIAFVCTDNAKARALVFNAASQLDNVDVFSAGNGSVEDGDGLFGTVYHYRRRDGKEVTAHPADYHAEFRDPKDRNPGELNCAERAKLDGGSQTVAANMSAAAITLAMVAQRIFNSNTEEVDNYVLGQSEIIFDWSVGQAAKDTRPPLVVAN